MIAPRWRKVLRDVFERRGRSLLAVLAMAAGVFEITAMVYKYALLQPELTTMYARTRPSSATLTLDRIDDGLVDAVRRVPGVGAAEARPVVVARVRSGDAEWVPAVFYVVRDFDRQHLDTFGPEDGAWPPAPADVLLERSAIPVANVEIGDALAVRIAGEADRRVTVSGTAHAPGLAPAWMEHMVPGFIAWDSPLRGAGESAQLRITVAEHRLEEGWIREVADSVKSMLERSGVTVTRVTVPAPGRHPHADQMEAFLFLLLAFGILSFLLSAVLVAGMIHALMSEQVKQVGMMKAIGATDRQVAGIYLGQVGLLAVAALVVGIPTGLVVGRAYAAFAAGILNTDISHAPFPLWVPLLIVAVGLAVPLLVALGPIAYAARITVREALGDDLPAPRPSAGSGIAAPAWLPRPFLLSLRATFARRARLALTVGLLAMGGAAFMSALNVASAWIGAVDADFARRRYDLTVALTEPQPIAALQAVLARVPDVTHAEFWAGASPYLIGPDGVPTSTISLLGVEPGSRLLDLRLLSGRWLDPRAPDGVVLNRAAQLRNPALGVGDSVRVRIAGRTVAFPVVGVVRELAPMAVIYAQRPALLAATGQSGGTARSIRVVTRGHDDAAQRSAARALEAEFEREGIEVGGLQRMQDVKQGILDHLVIILSVLTIASLVVVVVGSLGLASTLTLNVVQRTREIGILGAIGATPSTIARHVWFEALVIGMLSWIAGMVLAAPISWALEVACGNIFFRTPLDFHVSPLAAAAWLVLVLVLASVSSFYPARRAARLTVREALAHI